MQIRAVSLASASAILLGAMAISSSTPVQAATINVGVAPSPNGYVMAGVPTQVAVSTNAAVYRKAGGKWLLLGKATKAAAVPVTFATPGIQTLKVSAGKSSKIVKVGVYDTWRWGELTPTKYGDTILNSIDASNGGTTWTGRGAAGCVLVDAGVHNSRPDHDFSLQVASTQAPERNVPVPAGSNLAVTHVPVAGDVVVTLNGYRNPGGLWGLDVGMQFTCLSNPTN